MVANMVGLGSSNNGSDMISLTCTVAYPEALRQQSSSSDFLTALNEAGETYPGIGYTTIATRFDEVVAPYDKAFPPAADNDRNITLQDQCPGEPVEHFLLTASSPVWELQLAVRSLDANPDPRADPSACQKLMPGVDVARILRSPTTHGDPATGRYDAARPAPRGPADSRRRGHPQLHEHSGDMLAHRAGTPGNPE